MMLLKRVELENFGPYFGTQTIELKGDSNELVLVHGENMAGKTSLLNAVRWCLYGEAKDRSGASTPTQKLINADAWDAGDKRVGVSLDLLDRTSEGDVPITLHRQRQPRQGISSPTAEKDFSTHLAVDLNGHILAEDQFDDTVNSLLPESISRFFLFDGELLREYEELLQEDSTAHARQVKRAIEMILGVPAVQNGKTDLAALQKDAARAFNREAKKHKGIEEAARNAETLQDEAEHLEAEQEKLHSQEESVLRSLRAVKEELSKHAHLAESARLLATTEQTLERLDGERVQKLLDRRELAKEVWRDVLAPRLRQEIFGLEREHTQIAEAINETRDLEIKHLEREKSIADERCGTCGQPIPDDLRLQEQNKLTQVIDRIDQLKSVADETRLNQLGTAIGRMRDIAPAGVDSAIKQLEKDLVKIAIDEHKAEREKENAESDLRGVDPKLVPEFEQRRDHLNKHLGQIEKAVKETEEALGEKHVALQAQKRAMGEKDEPGLMRLRIVRDMTEELLDAYERSVDDLTDDLRSNVERQASEIFRELTTDKTYSGLRINSNYGLTILDMNNSEVPVRSAGAEQVVALSLIGALNRLASRRGPVIMDTPFGRLDRQHRENILRFIPTLADQVALLVHSGEIDPERDLEPVKGKVSAELDIIHIASGRSELRSRK